jgi:hypothetical protein
MDLGLGLGCCSTPLSTIYQLYLAVSFTGGGTGVPVENHRPERLYHIMLYRVHFAMSRIRTHNVVEMSTYCIGSCKSIFHTITTMTYVCMYVWSTALLIDITYIQTAYSLQHKTLM